MMLLAALRLGAESRLLSITNVAGFHREASSDATVVLTSPPLTPGIPWKELVVSWNAATNVDLTVSARPVLPGEVRYLSLGRWTLLAADAAVRGSVNGQKEPWGEVQTDVLSLRDKADAVQVRLEVRGPPEGLHRLALAFSGGGASVGVQEPFTAAWGQDLSVPVRSQAEFPEGVSRWCSPTSTSMLIAHWGEQRGRADWMPTVPETARAVFDPGWDGTGNWPFNMAFAGAHRGLNGVVARWDGLADLERWIAAGLPAAASVSYAMLKGRPSAESGDGHLVVVRGFTASGDVRVNDPGVRRDRVVREFSRKDFDRAWAHSGRTVYLVWPDGYPVPEGPRYPR